LQLVSARICGFLGWLWSMVQAFPKRQSLGELEGEHCCGVVNVEYLYFALPALRRTYYVIPSKCEGGIVPVDEMTNTANLFMPIDIKLSHGLFQSRRTKPTGWFCLQNPLRLSPVSPRHIQGRLVRGYH
jgi:hypothetical protein